MRNRSGSASRIEAHDLNSRDVAADTIERAYASALQNMLQTDFVGSTRNVAMTRFQLGPLHVIECDADARRSARTPDRIAHDRFDSISFQYVSVGRSVGRGRGQAIVSVPDTVMILDLAQPFMMLDEGRRVVINVSVRSEVRATASRLRSEAKL